MKHANLLRQYSVLMIILLVLSCQPEQKHFQMDTVAGPGASPAVMAPGWISRGLDERDGCFTPDGRTFYYSVWTGGFGTILMTRLEKDGWSVPEVAPFSGVYSDVEPFVAPDGDRIFFASNRPLKSGESVKDYDIWMIERNSEGWSEPKNLKEPVNTK